MNFRRILTASLLLFVATSIVTLVGRELRGRPVAGVPSIAVPPETPGVGRQIIAYYFVGKVRCSSCRKIEQVARKTIGESFSRELADGRLRFLVVNVDQPENRHFVEEFRLDSSALVLAEHREAKRTTWKHLRDVWPLVEEEEKLVKYVRDEVAAMLKGI